MNHLLIWSIPFLLCCQSSAQRSETAEGTNVEQTSTDYEKSQDSACKPLELGKSVTVSEDKTVRPRRNERKFKVTHTTANEYLLELNLQYLPTPSAIELLAPGHKGAEAEKIAATNMLQKVNSCFESYGSLLSDPNGNRLKVKVFTDERASDVPLGKVTILGKEVGGGPANFKYRYDEDCSIIVHESLHWTGLVDGYSGWPNDNSCRHFEPRDSIYGSASWALDKRVDINVCVCKSKKCNSEPYEVLDDGKLECPVGYSSEKNQSQAASTIKYLSKDNRPYASRNGVKIKTRSFASQPTHALKAMQLKAMTNPYCIRDNLYMQCMANAYRDKKRDGCENTPLACKQADWLK